MSIEKSKLAPTAFWVGFLALGFAASLGSPAKHRASDSGQPIIEAQVLAQTEKPVRLNAKAAVRD